MSNPFNNRTCKIGFNVYINPNYVTVNDYVKIGSNTIVGESCSVRAHEEMKLAHSEIGKGATIGSNCIVYSGCTIGAHALVRDGSIVVSDVGENEVYGGNPARYIGSVCNCGEQISPSDDWSCWCSTKFGGNGRNSE